MKSELKKVKAPLNAEGILRCSEEIERAERERRKVLKEYERKKLELERELARGDRFQLLPKDPLVTMFLWDKDQGLNLEELSAGMIIWLMFIFVFGIVVQVIVWILGYFGIKLPLGIVHVYNQYGDDIGTVFTFFNLFEIRGDLSQTFLGYPLLGLFGFAVIDLGRILRRFPLLIKHHRRRGSAQKRPQEIRGRQRSRDLLPLLPQG